MLEHFFTSTSVISIHKLRKKDTIFTKTTSMLTTYSILDYKAAPKNL